MKPIKIEYKTSLEKWRGIKKFAELNDLSSDEIDAMIKRIKKVGDASLKRSYTLKINDFEEFFDAFYNSDEQPCPHCRSYTCNECPLDDDSFSCCAEWAAVIDEFIGGGDVDE